jgi:hypothetical protein
MKIIQNSQDLLKLRLGGPVATASICTFDRLSGRAEIAGTALAVPVGKHAIPLADVRGVEVKKQRRGTTRKSYALVLELKAGRTLEIASHDSESAIEAARAIRAFLKLG